MAGKQWMKTRPGHIALAALAWTLLGFVFALPDLSAPAGRRYALLMSLTGDVTDVSAIHRRFMALRDSLDERSRRLVAAAESLSIGWGGMAAVTKATGMAGQVIRRGMDELREAAQRPVARGAGRIRRAGGGRKRTVDIDATLLQDLELLVDPLTRGDPESPLRWTCKSVRKLAAELKRKGHSTSHRMVAELLHELGYSLQGQSQNQRRSFPPGPECAVRAHQPPRRWHFMRHGQPVISVDTKKKELVGEFKNGGP